MIPLFNSLFGNLLLQDKVYLCIDASDTSDQNLMQFFQQCNEFIHAARVNGGCVLVHWFVEFFVFLS